LRFGDRERARRAGHSGERIERRREASLVAMVFTAPLLLFRPCAE